MNKKLIFKILIGTLIFLSLAVNAYYFGKQAWEKQKGKWRLEGAAYVFQQAKEKGQISFSFEDGIITLIPK